MEKRPERSSIDRRFARRHNVRTAVRVRAWKSSIPEHRAESVNISERGLLFATDTPFREGEAIEVLLKMPEEITGEPTTEWRCTGPVIRVEDRKTAQGKLSIAMRFDCYEVSRCVQVDLPVGSELPSRASTNRTALRRVGPLAMVSRGPRAKPSKAQTGSSTP